MKTYYDLQPHEQIRVQAEAYHWHDNHTEHVNKLLDTEKPHAYSPSGSDLFRPELWKAGHWRWFKTHFPKTL